MKLKYPKKIKIGSTNFIMKYDKKDSGGEFSYGSKGNPSFIRVGINCSISRQLEIFIHEVKEIINFEQGVRLDDPTVRENYIFVYHHKEHTDFCSRLAGILTEFIK